MTVATPSETALLHGPMVAGIGPEPVPPLRACHASVWGWPDSHPIHKIVIT
jgi:hypothetical protein